MRKQTLILALIIFIAAFLRFWQLGQNPPSLTWDEVSWGYNAYSLGIDGRDEFGNFLPLQYLESFGDFKPPLYAYLDILPVKIFGLNEFAVRFPSALLGTLTVLITYFLAKRIFDEKLKTQNSKLKTATQSSKVEIIALLSSFFLAISPWHVNLSRAAFEANVATFFLVTGVWLFLGGVQDKKWHLSFSMASFVLAMYTFNTSRIVAPALVLLLSLGFYGKLLKSKKQLLIAAVLGAILFLPLAQFLTTPQSQLRFHEVNIFSKRGVIERTNQEIANDQNAGWSKILHNRRFAYGVEYLKHYFDNLNPSFLFIKGDGNPKFSTQDVGQLYLWELPFLISGILLLFKKRESHWWVIPAWFVVGIAPAATARETPHALRIETILPTFQILVAYGFYQFISGIRNYRSGTRKLLLTACCLLLVFNFLYYFHGYWAHYPREFSGEWQYGYKEAIAYAESRGRTYDKVYFTEELGRPYIYFLFYTGYDPEKFRQEARIEREVFGFVNVKSFGKYIFAKELNLYYKQDDANFLVIGIPNKIPETAKILKIFPFLNGQPSLVAYTL